MRFDGSWVERRGMRYSLRWLLTALSVWALGCQDEEMPPVFSGAPPVQESQSDSAVFTETVDLIVGAQVFRSVDVIGTIHFAITPAADSVIAGKRAATKPYEVFVHTEMRFRRSQDYTMTQSWSAGGKSGDRVMLDEGTMALLTKSYQIWSIPNEAYINITYGVTLTSVGLRILWVSYEPLRKESGIFDLIPP